MTTEKERLIAYAKSIGINQSQIESKCGLATGTISHSKGTFSNKVKEAIFKAYPLLDKVWFLTGEGSMTGGIIIDNDFSTGKHIQSPHTEITGDSAAAAAMQAKIEALEAQVKSLEQDKVKLMNMLDKCIGGK